MPYTDARGRPELVMHPDIKRGGAAYRVIEPVDSAGAPQSPETPVEVRISRRLRRVPTK